MKSFSFENIWQAIAQASPCPVLSPKHQALDALNSLCALRYIQTQRPLSVKEHAQKLVYMSIITKTKTKGEL